MLFCLSIIKDLPFPLRVCGSVPIPGRVLPECLVEDPRSLSFATFYRILVLFGRCTLSPDAIPPPFPEGEGVLPLRASIQIGFAVQPRRHRMSIFVPPSRGDTPVHCRRGDPGLSGSSGWDPLVPTSSFPETIHSIGFSLFFRSPWMEHRRT